MITKTYISDMDVRISVNGKEIHFSNGYWLNGQRIPARLITSDEAIQREVERNPLFGNRIDCIEAVVTDDEKAVEKKEEVVAEKKESTTRVYDDVTDIKQAMEILTAAPYNLKVVQCNILGKIRSAEKKFNISFPNL